MSGANEVGKQDDGRPDESRIIHYLVNGERQRTKEKTSTVDEVLRHAGVAAGAIILPGHAWRSRSTG